MGKPPMVSAHITSIFDIFCYRSGDHKEVEIIYCQTVDKTANFLTKSEIPF